MTDMEYVLDFAVRLGRDMIECGANLERVNTSMYKVCSAYGLEDITLFTLCTHLSVSARDSDGKFGIRQVKAQPAGTHLERLRSLNELSFHVCGQTPAPERLGGMLEEARNAKSYSTPVLLLCSMAAMGCICWMNGGTWRDIPCMVCIIFDLFWLTRLLNRTGMNRIIINALCTFLAGTVALSLVNLGIADNLNPLIATSCMYLIPGIPMVNAARNILCGNEMNGILEAIKIILETMSIVGGLALSLVLCGGIFS